MDDIAQPKQSFQIRLKLRRIGLDPLVSAF